MAGSVQQNGIFTVRPQNLEEDRPVRVLLVEDEPLIREIMSESLLEAGYEVVEAESGVQAVVVLRDPSRRVDILVTDFHMPGGIDGGEVASQARQALPDIPVIIASGRPDALQPAWRERLAYVFLKKPYLPSELIRLVRQLVAPPTPEAGS